MSSCLLECGDGSSEHTYLTLVSAETMMAPNTALLRGGVCPARTRRTALV